MAVYLPKERNESQQDAEEHRTHKGDTSGEQRSCIVNHRDTSRFSLFYATWNYFLLVGFVSFPSIFSIKVV